MPYTNKSKVMKNTILKFILLILLPGSILAQDSTNVDKELAGQFSLGLRTTVSGFTDDGAFGNGVGGQFRIRASKKVNTDWFLDYITTDLQGLGKRTDGHIGWSVLFYLNQNPLTEKKFSPYMIAGHCFDYTQVTSYNGFGVSNVAERWSSAVQGGMGCHYSITERVDLTGSAQYMLHLGTHLDTKVVNDAALGKRIDISSSKAGSVEGHLLMTLSLNVRLADLW